MSFRPRRRSLDSSDSDSEHKEYKKDKEHKTRDHQGYNHGPSHFPTGHGSPAMSPLSTGRDLPSGPGSHAMPFGSPAMTHLPPGHDSSSHFPSGYGPPAMPYSPGHDSSSHFPSGYSPTIGQLPSNHAPAMPQCPSHHDSPVVSQFPPSHGIDQKSISHANLTATEPPPYTTAPAQSAPPSSGFRIPLSATGAFPDPQTLGQPPCCDADGSPIYIGSALLGNSVHPCKIGKHLQPYVAVPYGGAEHGHHGRYDLLPYRPDQMEFVLTSHGRIPHGRRPIEGGYEDHGAKLYHGVALVNGIRIPGKTSEHLGACNVAFGGVEHVIKDNYEILCWR